MSFEPVPQEYTENDIRRELELQIARAEKTNLELAEPNETWVGSAAAFQRQLAKLFHRRRYRQLALSDLQSFYTANFRHPPAGILAANSRATRLLAQKGGLRLRRVIESQIRWLQRSLCEDGVNLQTEARIVLKGSRGTCALFAPDDPELGSFPRSCFEQIRAAVVHEFGDSDVDLDLLTNPGLPPQRFKQVRRCLVLRAAECLARIKRLMAAGALDRELAQRVQRADPAFVPARRASFVIGPAFRDSRGRPRMVPQKGLRCISALLEVGAFPGVPLPVRAPKGHCYLSSNELHFVNDDREVRFTLLRCMMAFRFERKLAHAEIVDISVPHRERSDLGHAWARTHVQAPDVHRFGPNLCVLAPIQQLRTLVYTINNARQPHKMRKRLRRTVLLTIILLAVRRRANQELSTRALCSGATLASLEQLPDRSLQLIIPETPRAGWAAASACAHSEQLRRGHVFWQGEISVTPAPT